MLSPNPNTQSSVLEATSSPLRHGPIRASQHDQAPRAPRVCQVDADDLDEGLISMLGERIEKSLTNFKLSWDARPEIKLLLKLFIMYFGLFKTGASPGAALQNLKLVSSHSPSRQPSRRLLVMYLVLHPPIVPNYLITRLRNHALSRQWPDLPNHDWRSTAWAGLVRVENVARALELLGWVLFLWDGRYPSVVMRALGLRLVPASPHLTRMVSYEYMNRQLVWGVFTEFLMFSLPLVPPLPGFITPSAILEPIKSLMSTTKIDYSSLPYLNPNSSSSAPYFNNNTRASHSGPFASLPIHTCPICYRRNSSTPVSLSSQLSLPPIDSPADVVISRTNESGYPNNSADGGGNAKGSEETKVFVPAQADCWGKCLYCYYCIAEELVKFQQGQQEMAKRGIKKKGKSDEKDGWSCLRCGGVICSATRLGR